MDKFLKRVMILVVMSMFLCLPLQAHAYTGFVTSGTTIKYYNQYGNLLKGTWLKYNNEFYYAKKDGTIATGLTTINDKLYYFTSKGVNKTGWIITGGKRYYFMKRTREAIVNKKYKFSDGKTYYFNANGWMCQGWRKINGIYYFFKPYMKTGWITYNDHLYYLIKAYPKTGQRALGLFSIQGVYYYFDPTTGVMQTSKTVTVDGAKYKIDANGVCTKVSSSTTTPTSSVPANMLFFLTFESGSAAYNQTGGDSGNACGAYQFDYRYSLLSFVQYAYKKDSTLCAEFKKYASLSTGSSLHSNSTFYTAWHKIYNRNPKKFAALQDSFAKENYYDPVQRALKNAGIDISGRAAVVKGAVYSYSIQHGQTSAVNAVKAIKVTGSMSNATFLKKLYDYRISRFPAYKSRYTAEYKLALSKL